MFPLNYCQYYLRNFLEVSELSHWFALPSVSFLFFPSAPEASLPIRAEASLPIRCWITKAFDDLRPLGVTLQASLASLVEEHGGLIHPFMRPPGGSVETGERMESTRRDEDEINQYIQRDLLICCLLVHSCCCLLTVKSSIKAILLRLSLNHLFLTTFWLKGSSPLEHSKVLESLSEALCSFSRPIFTWRPTEGSSQIVDCPTRGKNAEKRSSFLRGCYFSNKAFLRKKYWHFC